jgi:P27 family predicted phage terminase small subunit
MSRPVANPLGNPRGATTTIARSASTAGHGVYNTEAHRDTVVRYVQLLDRRDYFLRVLDEEGWMKVGSQGQEVLHPLARQLDSLEGKLVPLEDRLGLSPEASVRLGIATIEHKSKLDDFLSNRQQ